MKNEKIHVSRGGVSFGMVLTIVFVVLKLVGVIAWPWVWVLAPLWISAALTIIILLITLLVVLIANKY